MTYPECACEETCFYPLHKGMPKEEEIATALLQLTNNPALSDKWAAQNGLAFKADGQVFTPARIANLPTPFRMGMLELAKTSLTGRQPHCPETTRTEAAPSNPAMRRS